MNKKIFVSLPVKDLENSKEFFNKLGYSFNHQFTDENAACMVISDDIYVMLITEDFFKTFTDKNIANAKNTTEVIICLNEESCERVDQHIDKATKAGGTEIREPQEYEYMYTRSFSDLDGHIWEIIWMNESAIIKT